MSWRTRASTMSADEEVDASYADDDEGDEF